MFKKSYYWLRDTSRKHRLTNLKTLDIGAWYRTANIKRFFNNYTGIDLQPGGSVDFIMSAYDIDKKFEKNSFEVVLCLNVLEHIADIKAVLQQVDYVLKKGGYFIVSMPYIDFPLHNYPSDYWRCTEASMREFIMKGFEIIDLSFGRSIGRSRGHFIDCIGRKL